MPVLVVDDAIAHADLALGSIAELHRVPAASIPEVLARVEADGLIVRSVTRVDASLLDRAKTLGLVATATAGTDHLDLVELEARGITVASAAGCNARAVAEWVVAALELVAPRLASAIAHGPIGVVGFGHVGSRLTALLRALGHEVLACDPPLARAGTSAEPLVGFAELWRRCSIVSFHVPLTTTGPDPTIAYLDLHAPADAGPKLIVNTSRGEVVRDAALDRADVHAVILDVWDGEPQLRRARLRDPKLLLASPHVAGYSLEAKISATASIHAAVSAWLGLSPSWTGAELLGPCELDPALPTLAATLAEVIDFAGDDARTRALALLDEAEIGPAFEALRRGYALRREFSAWTVAAAHPGSKWLLTAGFRPPRAVRTRP